MGKPTHVSSNKRRQTKTPMKVTDRIHQIKSAAKPKAKNKRKQLSRSSVQAVKQNANRAVTTVTGRSRRQSSDSDDEFKTCHVSAKRQRDWQELTTSSKEFIQRILESNISAVLHKTKPENYELVQQNVNALKQRILQKLNTLRAPVSRNTDYNHIHTQAKSMTDDIENEGEFLRKIEFNIEKQENNFNRKQDHLTQLREQLLRAKENTKNNRKQLHPLLKEDYSDEPTLPSVAMVTKQSKSKSRQISADNMEAGLLEKMNSVQQKVEIMKVSSIVQNAAAMVDYLEKI